MDKENSESVLNQVCFTNFRLKTFESTQFEKYKKCSAKKLAEAGFYYCPSTEEADKVKCYACGIEIFDWNRSDDPW